MENQTENLQNVVISPQERQEFDEFKRQIRVAEARAIINKLELSLSQVSVERASLRRAMKDAEKLGLGGVCVTPYLVKPCADFLGGVSPITVAAAISVWGGTDTTDIKVRQVKRALRDGAPLDRTLYATGHGFASEAAKLLRQGQLITIRPHTRFVHFPEHRHNYVELIYMCSGSTTHIINGTQKVVLQTGDLLPLAAPRTEVANQGLRRLPPQPPFSRSITVRVIPGPQEDRFSQRGLDTFYHSAFTVTDKSDRMGCRLSGPKIEHSGDPNIISDGIPLGAVQVPGSGEPMIRESISGRA